MKARKTLLIMVIQGVAAFLGWFSIFILARLWGSFAPTAIGIVAFGMSFVGMFMNIGNAGFGGAHIKRLSEGQDEGKCIGAFLFLLSISNVIMVGTILAYIFIMEFFFGVTFYDATKKTIVYIFILQAILLNFSTVPINTFQGREEIARANSILFMEPFTKSILFILVGMAGFMGASIGAVEVGNMLPTGHWPGPLEGIRTFVALHALGSLAMCYTLAALLMVIFGFFLLRHHPISMPDRKILKSYMSFSLPLLLVLNLQVVQTNIDKVMIGFYWSANEVGYYFVAWRIMSMLLMLTVPVGQVIFPAFSRYSSQGNKERIKSVVEKAVRYLSLMALPLIPFFLLFNDITIDILASSAFRPAGGALFFLSLYVLFTTLVVPFRSVLYGTDNVVSLAKVSVVVVLTNVILNVMLIPSSSPLAHVGLYGPTGAAAATAISAVLFLLLTLVPTRGYYNLRRLLRHSSLHLVAALDMFIFLKFLDMAFPMVRWYQLICYAMAGLVVYIGALYVLGEWKKGDMDLFLDAFNVKKMWTYIRSEFRRHKK